MNLLEFLGVNRSQDAAPVVSAPEPTQSSDGLTSFAMGMMGDKLSAYACGGMDRKFIADQSLSVSYSSNWLASAIIDIPVQDAMSKAPTWGGEDSKNQTKEVNDYLDKTGFFAAHMRGRQMGRLYGGAIGVVVTKNDDKPGALALPLDPKKVEKDGFVRLLIAVKPDVSPSARTVQDMRARDYGMPESYVVSRFDGVRAFQPTTVHHSRVFRYGGVATSPDKWDLNGGWDDSALERVWDAMAAKNGTSRNMASMTFEATVDILEVPNLNEQFQTRGGEERLQKRMSLANMLKGNMRMLLIGSGEKYTRNAYTFSGLKDVWESVASDASGAADIPMTRLFKRTPSGLQNTGHSDMAQYYERIERDQKLYDRPAYEFYMPIIMRSVYGFEPEWTLSFPPMGGVSPKERAEIDKANAQRDEIYAQMGLPEETIFLQLKNTGVYPDLTDDALSAADNPPPSDDDEKALEV